QAEALLEPLCGKEVVICCEVGSGVIPLAAEDRRFRETTGRLLVQLARRADSVVRIVAGIPMAIKGELPCRRS
ncbi:MAG: bifunctional adenosylcobinamide kinase/adenosylcobinamide-phosphate guanylyltransferase, partial [Lachnospiraceae bacterium]|nr:bifunctional adenosylcobinamide kinase/adenosylcobinamide-phosphate guanylyltransferase [Lachnospiraceae bacterium]